MRIDPALAGGASFTAIAPPTAPVNCSCTLSGTICKASTGCTCAAPVGGLCAQPFNASVQGLCTGNLSKLASAVPVQVYACGVGTAQNAAVLFVSHGTTGAGAYLSSPVPNASGTSSGGRMAFTTSVPNCNPASACQSPDMAAACNANGKNQFVDGLAGSSYDDMMIYADRNALVSMLGNPGCQVAW